MNFIWQKNDPFLMFASLKNHPFAVEAFFETSMVLTFAVPQEELQRLIPECLTLDTFKNKWGFIAIAMVQTKDLRPKGFPKFMGSDFFLIGYRVFVRFKNTLGKNLRGLYILKSETDRKKMEVMGNIFTHYQYTTTDINKIDRPGEKEINSIKSTFHVTVSTTEEEVSLPENSPFADWKEARRFAGPLPFTFTYNRETREVLIIEGVRRNWTPAPLGVNSYRFAFLDSLGFKDICLANAFIIKNVPYYWKRGKIERWR